MSEDITAFWKDENHARGVVRIGETEFNFVSTPRFERGDEGRWEKSDDELKNELLQIARRQYDAQATPLVEVEPEEP